MSDTGVFARPEEIEKIEQIADRAANTPAIALTSAAALSGRDWATVAWTDARKACHALALAHGLPEIEGYYGMNKDGEFITV